MAKAIKAKTGTKAPASGQYKGSGAKTEITLTKGERVPPNNGGKRQEFKLVDKTKHKGR